MSRLYRTVCGNLDAVVNKTFPSGPINRLWHHEAGPKTIFFWAPMWKWTIVIAGIADLARPAHSLSNNAALALIANGTVYTRWYGWAIIPRNVIGAACSFFTGMTGVVQFGRRQHYEMYIQGTPDDPLMVETLD